MNLYAKQIAVLLTATVTVVVIIALFLLKMTWPPKDVTPPGPDPYIEMSMDENFIEPILEPVTGSTKDEDAAPALTEEDIDRSSQLAPETGTALQDRGEQGEPAKVVTQNHESSVKTTSKPQPQKTGPAKPKPDPKAATEKQTNNVVSNAFSNAGRNNAVSSNTDQGRTGHITGRKDAAGPANSNSTKSGIGSKHLGGGWIWPPVSNKIKADKTGSVIIEFIVDPSGKVIKAVPIGGEAPAASLYGARCAAIVNALHFTRTDGKTLDHNSTGRITFTFK